MQVQESIAAEPTRPPHILVVDDEPSVVDGLKMVLADEGYGVDIALTGTEALYNINRKGADLMLADLKLPDIDGLEVIRQVKNQRPETEVVVITGYPSVASAVESAKLGVRDYLRKPFTDEEVKAAVEGALVKKETASMEKFLAETKEGRLIQKREVLRVLDLAYDDRLFWRELWEKGSEALADYHLSTQAKAAIISGDLAWINKNVGELTQRQLKFIMRQLEREAW